MKGRKKAGRMADSTCSQQIIREMVQRIVERFHPEKIILFGSYARGNPQGSGDVDLLVVLRGPISKKQAATDIYKYLGVTGLPKDVIVATPDELERYRDMPGHIIRPALRDGKVLYERTT